MNEIVEVVYQWHQGAGLKAISRSLGFDPKTVRKYVQLAHMAGVTRSSPFPDEAALISRFKEMTSSSLLRERPAQDVLASHREWMGESRVLVLLGRVAARSGLSGSSHEKETQHQQKYLFHLSLLLDLAVRRKWHETYDNPQQIAGRHSPRSRFLIPPPSGCAIRIEIARSKRCWRR
jgi:hypothetical protein